jgi:hypothetical protein
MTLEELVKQVAQARKEQADAQARLLDVTARLHHTFEWEFLQTAQDELKEKTKAVDAAEFEAKYLALSAYDGKDKHPQASVTIKEFDVVEYDPDKAKEYALEHKLPDLLKLDKQAFEAAAKAMSLPFVKRKKEARAQLDKDLSVYLIVG